jgi:hypothetical protein
MFLFLDAIRMIRDIQGKGRAIGLWGALLNIPQLIGGLVFILTVEGRAILVVEIVCLSIAGQIHKRKPFSRLIGICHVPWLALLPWLAYRLVAVGNSPVLAAWLWYVAATILVSLVFDVRDVWLYWRGGGRYNWSR